MFNQSINGNKGYVIDRFANKALKLLVFIQQTGDWDQALLNAAWTNAFLFPVTTGDKSIAGMDWRQAGSK
ncbi:hypothetical protein AL542_11770 [Grimontia hollisae]|nr:hypothetical protein AL542_11770 [Grimontia hollisae]